MGEIATIIQGLVMASTESPDIIAIIRQIS